MKTPYILTFLFAVFSVFIFYDISHSNADGSPAGNTGAPGETTCGQSGCHNSFPVNTGTGEVKITLMDGTQPVLNYEPGETYDVEVRLRHKGMTDAGFQITVLDDNDDFVGSFTAGNDQKTVMGMGRSYVTHSSPGTGIGSDSIYIWNMEWTAPNQNAGAVTFYAAGNAADNSDTTNSVDYIYTTGWLIDAGTSLSESIRPRSLEVYPNPVSGNEIFINLESPRGVTSFTLFDQVGKQIENLQIANREKGKFQVSLNSELKPGVYYLRINEENQHFVKKLLIE